jgi:hypothetical protein
MTSGISVRNGDSLILGAFLLGVLILVFKKLDVRDRVDNFLDEVLL